MREKTVKLPDTNPAGIPPQITAPTQSPVPNNSWNDRCPSRPFLGPEPASRAPRRIVPRPTVNWLCWPDLTADVCH